MSEIRDSATLLHHEIVGDNPDAPWMAPPMEAAMGGWDAAAYPQPILDLTEAAREARDRMWAFRKRPDVKAEGRRILARHVVPARARAEGRMREL